MVSTRFLVTLCLAGPMVLGHDFAHSQSYPNKTIRIVTAPAGGGSDFAARMIAQGITPTLGQQIIVDNRGSNVTGELVSKAAPDGYTLLLTSSGLWLAPFFQANVPYDPVRDFAPVTLATSAPNILVVHPSVPAKSVKELIAVAKSRPGELNYSSTSTGGAPHLAAELFKAMAGVNMVRVAHKGTGPALNSLLSGEVQLMFANANAVMPHVTAGKLRALAVTSAEPSELAPGLPTVAASGLVGFEIGGVDAIFAPAKTPGAVVNRLNQEIVRFLKQPEVKQKFLDSGAKAVGSSPDQLAHKLKTEMTTLGKVIKDTGMRIE